MNTGDSRNTSLPAWWIALAFALVSVAGAASLSEPPRVLHGKVVKLGQGGSYQLFSGTLQVKLVNLQSPSHVLDLDVPLRRVGSNGEFSYRIEIDQDTAPASDKLASTLAVGAGPTRYAIQSATVNGYPASLLDPGQAAEISTSFANRGEELRLDFRTDVPTPDADGDGIPDWWEQLYGLDPANGADALVDTDGDGWNNLKEFQLSTDPQTANRAPVLQDSLLVVTAGGTAGVYLPIADADTTAANLKLTLLEGGAGLLWKRAGAPLALGNTFTYADILAGSISVEVAAAFIKDSVRFQLEDLTTAGVAAREVAVVVEAFSPDKRWLADPLVWLDAGAVTQSTAVEQWTDRSTYRRDGYQPYPAARPLADGAGRLAFDASQFLYVDEREVDLGQFVALMAFELDAETESDQTLFSSSDLEVSIGGPQSGIHGRSLKVVQNGRTICGPVVDPHKMVQLTLASSEGGTELRIPGMGKFSSRAGEDAPLSSFTTVGARQPFSSPVAENFFNGSLRELLFYNRPLSPEIQGLIEDYQLARWQGVRVWNQRGSSQPVAITGATGVRNSICGGESDDTLAGADQSDILRGGLGNNRLTGKGSADHFLFSKTGGNDVITDFSAVAGDTIDLTELFAGKTGLPSQYVKLKTLTARDVNNVPRVDTCLELIYEGVGTIANQTITLEGVGWGSSDLARLLGEGTLKLGGPRYDSVIGLAISAADPASPGSPRKLTVSRSGNTSAAILVPLSLGGTARVDADYQIVGSQGTGAVRSVALARGGTQAVFDILPAPDRNALATSISITALPVSQVSDGGASLQVDLASGSTPTDTFVGNPYDLRVGNQVAFDLNNLLKPGEVIKVGGKIPSGLKYNATTGLLTGIISGNPGTYLASIQILQGKTVVRTLAFPITVLEFPSSLIGNFDFLMEDSNSVPSGVCKITITGANTWGATLKSAGASKKRSAKGTFILAEGKPVAPITAAFPSIAGAPAVIVNISIDGSTANQTGSYGGGTLRGFRLARTAENPPATVTCNLVLDAGMRNDDTIPAGLGWMKGKVSNKGIGTFKGLLGDSTAASLTLQVSACGQAVLWLQPYTNKNSFIGGIVTLGNLGQATPGDRPLSDEVWWAKAPDAKMLSYPNGFHAMPVTIGTSRWTAPAIATELGASLGWRNSRTASVTIEGAGLSNEEPQATLTSLPTEFTIDDKFNLIISAPMATPLVKWKGKASKKNGSFTGTLKLPTGFAIDVPGGSAAASGVLVQDESWGTVTGCGLIKVPTSGPKGSFRTAAVVIDQ